MSADAASQHVQDAMQVCKRSGARVALVLTIHPDDESGTIQVRSGSWGESRGECQVGRLLLDAAHQAVMGLLATLNTVASKNEFPE